MKLKTLKDIENELLETNKDFSFVMGFSLLKAEAVKWVKQHRNIKPNWAKETNEEFFMAFFNLTEEDLK